MLPFLIAVAVLLAAVLFVPIGVEVSAIKSAEIATPSVRTRLRWLVFTWEIGRRAGAERPGKPAIDRPGKRRSSFNIRAALTSPGFLSRCMGLVTGLGRLALPQRLDLRGRIGFEDPADTGMLLGWVYGFRGLPESRSYQIHVDPDFTGPMIEGSLLLRWSRSLASVAWPALTFVTSPVVWRAWKRGRKAS